MIKTKNLSFSYKDKVVLNNLNFSIDKKEFVSFVGPSGCGKTTLLNLISGILPAIDKSLVVDTKNISFVFQQNALLPWKSVIGNVLLPLDIKNTKPGQEDIQRAKDILKIVGLEGFEYYYPAELSGGMKKRVEIARALINNPDLLIMDEPFSSLDIITREKLNLLIREIHRNSDITIVLVTHSVEEACFLSNKVFVLSLAPAEIIDVKTIERKKSSSENQFILSSEELSTDKEIRKKAKLLWNMQPATSSLLKNEQKAKIAQKKINPFLIPFELLAIFIILTLSKYLLKIDDYIFPYPFAVFRRFFQTITDGSIFIHLGTTIYESLTGFFIAFFITLITGYIIAKSKFFSRLLMPYLIAFNTIPSVALAPFLVLWFGFGFAPKIIISVIVIFFPMLINNISAMRIAEEQMGMLIKFYKPGKLTAFLRFEFPASLPVIFSGVKVSITLSVIGAVVGEFVSGSKGLGALVVRAKANFDTELMFVSLIWLIILGLFYYGSAGMLYSFIVKKLHE